MENFVIINNIEYRLPMPVSFANQEIIENYKQEYNGKTYLNINKMVKEDKFEELTKISDSCCYIVGTLALEDKEAMDEINKLGPKIRLLDDMSKLHYQKKEYEKAYNKVITLMELMLKFDKKQQEKEQENVQAQHKNR